MREDIIGMMTDDLEDELELSDSKVKEEIAESYKDFCEGRTRPAHCLLAELEEMGNQERTPK